MPEYSAKLNLEKPLGTENVNRGFFTRLIDDIDSKAGAPNGLARLDQNGNVLKADGSLAGEVTAAQFTEHKEERSSVQKAGHVQLSDAISSTDTTKAATPNAVKKAYDRANEAFLSASNGKNMLTNAITGTDPRVVIPPDPSFGQLATAVRQIQTGKKWASGTAATPFWDGSNWIFTVMGLNFKPRLIMMSGYHNGNNFYLYSELNRIGGNIVNKSFVENAIIYLPIPYYDITASGFKVRGYPSSNFNASEFEWVAIE